MSSSKDAEANKSSNYFSFGIISGAVAAIAILFNFQASYESRDTSSSLRTDWVLTTNTFKPNHYQSAPYVSNGYFGQALTAEGTGYWVYKKTDGSPALNGWPLDQDRATFGTISGFWNLQDKVTHPILWENVERGGESVVSGIPDWTGLVVSTPSGEVYKPGVEESTVLSYSQSQSFADGIVATNVTWQPNSLDSPIQMNFTVLAHHERLTLGLVRLDLTFKGPTTIRLTDVIDGDGAVRSHFGDKGFEDDTVWTSVKPWGVENTTAYLASHCRFVGLSVKEEAAVRKSRRDATDDGYVVSQHMSTIAQSWDVSLEREQARTISIIKQVGISSSDAFSRRTRSVAFDTAKDASKISWEELIKEHRTSWNALWDDADIEIPGTLETQTTARAALFHLLSNSVPEKEGVPRGMTQNSISVGGLTSDSYAGLVFWDADVWMYPPLVALHPEHAKPILNYRQHLLPQALKNSQLYGRPGALYPWTSGRYGNCTGTGICAMYQYHLNTDIAMAHWNYFLHTRDIDWLKNKAWVVLKNVADMFAEYATLNESTGLYDTILMAEPDEFAIYVNNGAFTNTGIKLLLGDWAPTAAKLIGATIPANWTSIAKHLKVPYDEKVKMILEYDGMEGTVVIKQASVGLIPVLLGWQVDEEQTLNDIAFYSKATTADGPAMTWAINAITALQHHPTGCAGYTYLLQASQPYLREPFSQFSEQRTDTWSWSDASSSMSALLEEHMGTTETTAAFPFLTGYGGYLQIFTHGFTGMRPEVDSLAVDPVMIPQFKEGVKVKGIKFQGAVLDFDIGPVNATISRRRVPRGSTRPITIRRSSDTFTLEPGQDIVLPTRRPDLREPTMPGNLAQCQPARADSGDEEVSWVAGRHPVAAVDGSTETVWQPLTPKLASIQIALGSPKKISSIHVNWGNTPPTSFTVQGRNGEDGWVELLDVKDVRISAPYDPSRAHIVTVAQGNVTEVALRKPFEFENVKFTISGTQGNDKNVGATVAELSII